MLVIEAAFPYGRYYAARCDAPNQPEWPPHPSRLFSSLVAAAYVGRDEQAAKELEALLWLENQTPPLLEAPMADTKAAPTCYVPPGDIDENRKSKDHPIFRIGKERYFPSVFILGNPLVRYAWQKDPEPGFLDALDNLARRVTHMGTSHSMVLMRAYLDKGFNPTHEPKDFGRCYLRVPSAGRFAELLDLYSREKPLVRRPISPFEPLAAYHELKTQGVTSVLESPFSETIILRIRDLTYGLKNSGLLSKAFRKAIMSCLIDPLPPAVHGHKGGDHVAWLPLPDVGHNNASGRIMGIGLALPGSMTLLERKSLLKAVGEVIRKGVRLADGRNIFLETVSESVRPPRALQQATWTRASKNWATVSPVVPDRMPRKNNAQEFAKCISESLVTAGYPKPDQVVPSSNSILQGAPPAMEFPYKTSRFHAVVTFPQKLKGPVIAGRMRYFGGGFFRPLRNRDQK